MIATYMSYLLNNSDTPCDSAEDDNTESQLSQLTRNRTSTGAEPFSSQEHKITTSYPPATLLLLLQTVEVQNDH